MPMYGPNQLELRGRIRAFAAVILAIPALPAQSNLVARWDANAIAPQADNTALASWTDSINGAALTQATASAQPKYRSAALGGKPGVQFAGAAYMAVARTAATTMASAIDAQERTIIVIASGIGAAANGTLFSAETSGGNGPYLMATGSRAGGYPAITDTFPFADTGICVVGETGTKTASGNVASIVRKYLNGTCFYQNSVAPLTSGTQDFGVGGRASGGANKLIGTIHEVIVYNRALTPAEIVQVQSYASSTYGVANPLATITKFYDFEGDSLTVGQNASSPEFSYPALIAAQLGLSLGQWTISAVRGSNAVSRTNTISSEMAALATATGKRMVVAFGEWYNQGSAAPTPENNTRAFFSTLKSTLPTSLSICWTSIDNGQAAPATTYRTNYNTAFDNAHAVNIDYYAPVHNNVHIGVVGATAASDKSTYFEGANIHLTGTSGVSGYRELAGELLPSFQAAMAA